MRSSSCFRVRNLTLECGEEEDRVSQEGEESDTEDIVIIGQKQELTEDQEKPKPLKLKKKKVKKPRRLVMNVLNTKYKVVKYVARNVFNMRLSFKTNIEDNDDWDICWSDGGVQPERLMKMKPFQRINHFPGMFVLARKNQLGRNLKKMHKLHPDEYSFFPKTWLLPTDFADLRAQFQNSKRKTFICKPEASCQGRGIFLARTIDDFAGKENDHLVVQKYLSNPYLIEGLKFDL